MSDLAILPYERREARVKAWDPRVVDVAAAIAGMVLARRPDLAVEHIGSTAVPGLPGKGIVDLSVETPAETIPGVVADLYTLGLQPQPGPDPWPPTRPMLVGAVDWDGDEFRIHVHVQPTGGDHRRDLAFRDALRADPELVRQYAALKVDITGGGAVDAYRYTHSKTAWILGVYRRLGFELPTIRPPAAIGILGGGPLGRRLVLAAHRLGYRTAVLDPDPACPAAPVADRLEVGALDDPVALRRLAAGCAVVTTADVDRVTPEVLQGIDDGTVEVRPSPYALAEARSRTDGRLTAAGLELVVLVARGVDGSTATYPVVPAQPVADVAASAVRLATDLALDLGIVGLLAVRVVAHADGNLTIVRVVPGVGDSGPWTPEPAATDPFEQHVRAICGLALGPTHRAGERANAEGPKIGPVRRSGREVRG